MRKGREQSLPLVLKDIVCDAVVPVDVDFTVNGELLVMRQLLTPKLFVTVIRPGVAVKTAPEDGSAVFIDILLRGDTVVKALDIHNTDGVVAFAVDGDGAAADDVDSLSFRVTVHGTAAACEQAFRCEVCFVAAVIFAEAPVVEKGFPI